MFCNKCKLIFLQVGKFFVNCYLVILHMYTYITGETPRNSVLLTDTVKNYRPVSLLPCKQSLLLLSSNRKGKAKVAMAKVGWQKAGWPALDDQRPGGQKRWPGAPCVQESHNAKRRGQERESFVLRTYIVGGVGVKKLHFD